MNKAFDEIIASDEQARADLFEATAQRLGTNSQNVEKDFWVCWTLDALFNGLGEGPRLLFKGGTSLSKGFGLIKRFSEDIDVTVFRDDLGEDHSVEDLEALSRKKRDAALDAIKGACEGYINGTLLEKMTAIADQTMKRAKLAKELRVVPDDGDSQTLLVLYPSATPAEDYVQKSVRIESGAKSALDPNSLRTIEPYINADTPGLDLKVPNVTIVDPERTFWDKIVIAHGLRRWFEIRGELKGEGNRISRHYYDLHVMMNSEMGPQALSNPALGTDCVAHARMFFDRPAFDLASARRPSFSLRPEKEMVDGLRRDYAAMTSMIFGEPPSFDDIIETIAGIESTLNGGGHD